jgi:uncharacterized HAD superfamily protein
MKIPPEQIGFDFDGVIADIGEAFLRLACSDHNYCTLKLEEITSFQVGTCTKIPEIIVQKIFTDILKDSLATRLLPNPGAIDTITMLTQLSEVTIITARSLANPVSDWLENYLAPSTCTKIHLIAMSDHNEKVPYIKEQNLQFFVDDRAETCSQIAEAGLTPLLYQQPWNKSWNGYATVGNWQEIENLIEK